MMSKLIIHDMPQQTIRDAIQSRTGFDLSRKKDEIALWPPDVFAVTSVVLEASGAYCRVVSPPQKKKWPPIGHWKQRLDKLALCWQRSVAYEKEAPEFVQAHIEKIVQSSGQLLADLLCDGEWDLLCAFLMLHVLADHTCSDIGAGFPSSPHLLDLARLRFKEQADGKLESDGNLSRSVRLRVLPKLHTPQTGIQLRSLSHHLAVVSGEVTTKWVEIPKPHNKQNTLNILLIPSPYSVVRDDFCEVSAQPLANMDKEAFGFFRYSPVNDTFSSDRCLRLIQKANRHASNVDLVILPELAITESQLDLLRSKFASVDQYPVILSGIRAEAEDARLNRVAVDLRDEYTLQDKSHILWQKKHHRWCLDARQIKQYKLSKSLTPNRRWWEAINIGERHLLFVSLAPWFILSPLICEDLARQEPVSTTLRAIGPSLVVAHLFDGPQFKSRWPGRYATILAEDPGSAVLTLTAYGMAYQSCPPGKRHSRIVALWRDNTSEALEIRLKYDKGAILLTAKINQYDEWTADGRMCTGHAINLDPKDIVQLTSR